MNLAEKLQSNLSPYLLHNFIRQVIVTSLGNKVVRLWLICQIEKKTIYEAIPFIKSNMALPSRLINCLMIFTEYAFRVAKTTKKIRSSHMTHAAFDLVGVWKYVERKRKSEKGQVRSSSSQSIRWLVLSPCCKGNLHSFFFFSFLHFNFMRWITVFAWSARFSRAKFLECVPQVMQH